MEISPSTGQFSGRRPITAGPASFSRTVNRLPLHNLPRPHIQVQVRITFRSILLQALCVHPEGQGRFFTSKQARRQLCSLLHYSLPCSCALDGSIIFSNSHLPSRSNSRTITTSISPKNASHQAPVESVVHGFDRMMPMAGLLRRQPKTQESQRRFMHDRVREHEDESDQKLGTMWGRMCFP